ncbi:hypothetical protein SLA2020_527980 [Shorea laevis]
MITIPNTSSEPSCPSATPLQEPPPLNVMTTESDLRCSKNSLDNLSSLETQLMGLDKNTPCTEVGLLLSQQVEAQLSLGTRPITDKKHSNESRLFGEIFK